MGLGSAHRVVALIAGVLAVAGPAPGQDVPASAPASMQVPVILVERPVHDFGEVWVGTRLEHAFVVQNVGTAPLHIQSVTPSCGCTKAGGYPNVIGPGERAGFPFKVDGDRYDGAFKTTVPIRTDDPAHSMTTLTFQGVMKHYISIQPRGLYFGQVNEGSVATRSLTLTNNMDQPLRLTIPEGQQSETYTWELLDQEPGKVFELKVTAGPAYPDKTTKLNLRLDTNIPEWPKVEVLCLATVRERLEVQPAAITVFTGQGSESRRRIRLVDNGEAPVKVLSADPPADSGITTEIRGLATGKGYDIDLAIPAAYEPPEEGDRLVIRTDDKDKPELYVPIQAIPKQPSAERPPAPALELVGRPAPKATFKTYDNHEMTIGPGSEKVQLVMFYHSWCGFCKQSLPRVNAMWKQYESKGVEVVAVNLDSPQGRIPRTTEQVLDQYREFQLSLPMTLDRAGNIGRQYKVGPVPVFFLIGKSGVVEAFHSGAGAVRGNTLHEEIDLLLEGKTRADFPKSG